MIVEFIGFPGTGKTTVATKLAELSAAGLSIPERRLRCVTRGSTDRRQVIRSTRTNWRILLSCSRLAWGIRPLKGSRFRVARSIAIAFSAGLAEMKGNDIVVFDQWVCQSIWGMLLMGNSYKTRDLETLVADSRTNEGRAVVFMDIDPNTALERISLRKTFASRLDRIPAARAFEEMTKWRPAFEVICAAAERAGIEVLRLNGMMPSEENAKIVWDAIIRQRLTVRPGSA